MKIKCADCHTEMDPLSAAGKAGFCPKCSLPLAGELSGTFVDEIQIISELGRGNNGVVYLGRQYGVNRPVAVKVMLAESLEENFGVAMFFKEARSLAKLNHPNIVQAIAAGRLQSGNFYIVMEFIDGPSVENIIDSTGPPVYHEALRIAGVVANAMCYAWNSCGLIHGDIKPANIIMHHNTIPKIADLGLAQFHKVVPGELMATPLYAPPEVIQGVFEKMSYWSDIYSFGATLYEIFSGDPPFPGTEIDAVLKCHIEEAPINLTEKIGFFNPAVAQFIDRMLNKDYRLRPPSWDFVADFFAEQLEEVDRF